MIYSYEGLHYDVLNVGKQEVWMGKETFLSILDTTKCDFVSANLLDIKSKKPFVKPYVIRDYGNMRVGVLGLLNDADFPKGSSMLDSTAFAVTSAYDAAKKYVPMLQKKCDAVVLLCELPSTMLDTMCLQIPGIDLVVSTGALKSGEQMMTVGDTRIVGTGSSGYSGHYATIELNPAWKDSAAVVNFSESLTDTYEEKGLWADRVNQFNASPPPAKIPPAKTPGAVPAPGSQGTSPTITPLPTSSSDPTKKTG